MAKFVVTIRGPEGFLDLGRYQSDGEYEADSALKSARDAVEDVLNDLRSKGYVKLCHSDGSYSVTRSEAVLSFLVRPIEEEEK